MAVRIFILAMALGLLATVVMAQPSAERPGGPAPTVPPSPNEAPTPAPAPQAVSPSAKPPSASSPTPSGSSPPPSGESPAEPPLSPNAAPTVSTAWFATAAVALAVSVAFAF